MKAIQTFVWTTTRALLAFLLCQHTAHAIIQNTFSFRETDWTNKVYGPADWELVPCNDVDTCPGWPTNWETFNPFIPYDGSNNQCRDCSESTKRDCSHHQQSPIPLYRNVTGKKECKDRHKMGYETGNCRWDEMRFEIMPHVLRAHQPKVCQLDPVIDFSWGFPDWWRLEFTDIVVPSHHSQDGKEYAAEIILSHVYSKNQDDRMIGNVAVLLEVGTDADHYDFLELYIQQFAQEAQRVENRCAPFRQLGSMRPLRPSALATKNQANSTWMRKLQDNITSLPAADEDDILPVDSIDEPGVYVGKFNPYEWYRKCGTQYYFRYNGSVPEPPCFEGVHWRVLKDAIKVSPQQISDLEELFTRRLNPQTCEPDTAGKPRKDGSGKVDLNRPRQTVRGQHRLVFCECVDWVSRLPNDRAFCKLSPQERGVFVESASSASPSPEPPLRGSTPPPTTMFPSSKPSRFGKSPTECTCDPSK